MPGNGITGDELSWSEINLKSIAGNYLTGDLSELFTPSILGSF